MPLTEDRLQHCYPGETLSSICNGIPRDIDPRPVSEPSLPVNWNGNCSTSDVTAGSSSSLTAPYQPTEAIIQAGTRQPNRIQGPNAYKRKNYKGQHINDNVKVKIARPRLIDTRNIVGFNKTVEKTNTFSNAKKIESGITIKLLKTSDSKEKKITIRNPKYVFVFIHRVYFKLQNFYKISFT